MSERSESVTEWHILPAVAWGPAAAGGGPGAAEGSGLAAEESAAFAVELSLEVSS